MFNIQLLMLMKFLNHKQWKHMHSLGNFCALSRWDKCLSNPMDLAVGSIFFRNKLTPLPIAPRGALLAWWKNCTVFYYDSDLLIHFILIFHVRTVPTKITIRRPWLFVLNTSPYKWFLHWRTNLLESHFLASLNQTIKRGKNLWPFLCLNVHRKSKNQQMVQVNW